MSSATIDDTALPCPLCEYDLRATVEPRCPECGHAFDRAELVKAGERHPYLFDQQLPPIVGPFARTWVASLVPWTFWSTVKPHMRPKVPGLIIYWLLCSATIVVILGGPMAVLAYDDVLRYYGSAGLSMLWFDPVLFAAILYPLLFFLWPWLTVLAMNIFRATLRAASIRQGHLIRWAVYTAGFNIFLLPVFMVTGKAFAASYYGFIGPFAFPEAVNRFLIGAVFVMPIYCVLLTIAYSRYLRLPQPIATVLLNQIVVWLALWAILQAVLDTR